MEIHESLDELLNTLEAARAGFAEGVKRLRALNEDVLADAFEDMAGQHAELVRQLQDALGGDLDVATSSQAGKPQAGRGWGQVVDPATKMDARQVLDAALEGETRTVRAFRDVLGRADLTVHLRGVVQRQLDRVQLSLDRIRGLRRSSGRRSAG